MCVCVCATFCFVEFVYLILVLTNAIIRGEGLEKTKDHTSSPGGRLTGTGQAGQAS